MECTIENNLLHIKSDMFSHPGITGIFGYTFLDFLEMFFKAYHLENIEQLKHEWYRLKDEFETALNLFMSVNAFVML